DEATQQVVVVRIAAEREQRIATELLLRVLGGGLVEDGGYGDRDPLLARTWLTAARLSRMRTPRSPWPVGRDVAIPVGIRGAGVDRIRQDVMHRRRGPRQATAAWPVRPKVEAFQNLADAHSLVDEPAVHRAHQVRLNLIDDQVAGHALTFGHV